jgi:methyl-accepting chemotaxis protein
VNNLDLLRKTFSSAMIGLLWFNAALAAVASFWLLGGDGWMPALAGAALAGGATAMWAADPVGPSTRIVTAAGSATQVALLVYVFAGHPFQIDMHMYFFAVLAFSAGWVDERALLANAATVAVHHVLLNFVVPYAVFPEASSDMPRVLVHASVLILQTVVLCWMAVRLRLAFNEAERATHSAEDASRSASGLADDKRRRADDEAGRRGHLESMVGAFRTEVATLIEGLRQHCRQMSQTSDALTSLSAAATRDANAAADTSDHSSSALGAVAAATEEMSHSITEIYGQINGVKEIIDKVQLTTRDAQSDVAKLMEEAGRISDVVNIIQDIAGQTNLLALNATIEAARAGEMGKGFAVVAGEVKTLAQQTAKATDDISARIAAISSSTRSTVSAMEGIARRIEEATNYATAIVSSIDQQREATGEIAANASQAAETTQEVARVAGRSRETAHSTEASTQDLAQSASSVQSSADRLARTIDDFVRRLAA